MMFMDFKERTLMLSRFFLKVLLLSLLTSQVIAAPKKMPQSEFAAMATANALNSFKSVGDYITWLGMYGNKEDLEQVRAELVKLGVDLKAKFPKAKYKKDKVYFDKDNYIIYGKDSLTVNGKKVSLIRQSAREMFLGICAQIGCKKTTADFSLFPKAHAFFNWRSAIAGAAALGGLAYLFAPAGAAAGVVGRAAGAGFFLGGLLFNRQYYNNCQNNNYGNNYNNNYDNNYNCDVAYNNGGCTYTNGNQGNRVPVYGDYNQGQCDDLAYAVENPGSPLGYTGSGSGYGTDELDRALEGTTSVDTKDGKAKRGTTSVPKK
jgi:hypothetical protein